MKAGEENSPAKSSKPAGFPQETPTTPLYPDWSASMQACYGAGATPPPFFSAPVASQAPHPYLWGGQHPMVAPYGTPLPYLPFYPHGGLYAHSNMAVGAGMTNTEPEAKAFDVKERGYMKKSKGSPGITGFIGGKSGDCEKAASASGNDGTSQSAQSSGEGSSEASDENDNQQASSATKKRYFKRLTDEGNVKSNTAVRHNPSTSVHERPVPITNLNIGMDFWNASASGGTPVKMRLNASGASPLAASATMAGREGMLHDRQLYQDERELKREKRKQSNRESARRSRLRKMAECDVLQVKVEKLNNENQTIKDEMHRLAEECEKLTSENNSIMEELTQLYGPDAILNFQVRHHNGSIHIVNGEDNSLGEDTSTENNSNSISGQNGHFFNS